MKEEPTLESQRIYNGRVISLRVDTVQLPSGRTTKREIVEHPGAVAIIAIDDEGNVILVRQYRKAVDRVLLEIPAGTIEQGETAEECVRRELEEETGYAAGEINQMGGVYTSPGFCTEYLHFFLARGVKPGPPNAEHDENIEVVPIPLSQIPNLISRNEICDAKSQAALLRFLYQPKP